MPTLPALVTTKFVPVDEPIAKLGAEPLAEVGLIESCAHGVDVPTPKNPATVRVLLALSAPPTLNTLLIVEEPVFDTEKSVEVENVLPDSVVLPIAKSTASVELALACIANLENGDDVATPTLPNATPLEFMPKRTLPAEPKVPPPLPPTPPAIYTAPPVPPVPVVTVPEPPTPPVPPLICTAAPAPPVPPAIVVAVPPVPPVPAVNAMAPPIPPTPAVAKPVEPPVPP